MLPFIHPYSSTFYPSRILIRPLVLRFLKQYNEIAHQASSVTKIAWAPLYGV